MINMKDAIDAGQATGHTMRLQLALNVKDIDEAVEFYTKMFATEPAKRRPGYANFAIANPPLKLVLFEGGQAGTINHLGVETSTAEEVAYAEARIAAEGIETTGIDDTVCCFAEKTETWINGPDTTRWEWYVRTGDSEQMMNTIVSDSGAGSCCAPEAAATAEAGSPPDVCCS